jgi:prepilin-type N-terminal cleavage/methylation domain-containing protein
VTIELLRARGRDQRGLTLLEILLALAVIGVAFAGLGAVIPVSNAGIQGGHQLSTATFLAEQILERARAAAWTSGPAVDCLGVSVGDAAPVPTGATCRGATATSFPDESAGVSGHPHYRRAVRVTSCERTPCAGVAAAEMRLVEVTVAYTPVTAVGVSPSLTTVQLAWLVSQK